MCETTRPLWVTRYSIYNSPPSSLFVTFSTVTHLTNVSPHVEGLFDSVRYELWLARG